MKITTLTILASLTVTGIAACTTPNQDAKTTSIEVKKQDQSRVLPSTRGKVDKVLSKSECPKVNEVIGSLVVEENERDIGAKSRTLDSLAQPKRPHKARKEKFAYSPSVVGAIHPVGPSIRMPIEPNDRENYAHIESNTIKQVALAPVSTLSIDVDTASYSNVRRILNSGRLPTADSIRVEEMINYFDFGYPLPSSKQVPFSVHTEVGATPWNKQTQLLQIGIKGYEVKKEDIPPANLIFLIDVSGSMQSADKIGLLKQSMKLLVRQLRSQDQVSIVVYAGHTGVVLEPTSGKNKATIMRAIDQLTAGGSTNGGAGINLAYQMAAQGFIEGGINRILLATDGDFNVGISDREKLKNLVEDKRKGGVSLSTLGFGRGNYNDAMMEVLSNVGDGVAYYIDSLQEANRVLVEKVAANLFTIATDVKIQIEFNPEVVSEYRLVGYENRLLNRADFNNDLKDAGDIGAGHTVTALYEITLTGKKGRLDPLRYQSKSASSVERGEGKSNELAFLRLRYKQPGEQKSQLIEQPIYRSDIKTDMNNMSADFRFAASVAGFGQLLRGGNYTESFTFDDVHKLAQASRGNDPFGHRSSFLGLVRLSDSLQQRKQ